MAPGIGWNHIVVNCDSIMRGCGVAGAGGAGGGEGEGAPVFC